MITVLFWALVALGVSTALALVTGAAIRLRDERG